MASVHRIYPALNEGQDGDLRELHLADIRGKVRQLIVDSRGEISRKKAHELGQTFIPTMAATTIIRFATGETIQPSPWTIKKLSREVAYELVFVPKGAKLPTGSIKV